jgi:Protein of unknown function (DUF1800)
VFAYYPADYVLPVKQIPAPEFGIFNTSEFLNRVNQMNDLLFHNLQPYSTAWWAAQPGVLNSTGTAAPDMAAYLPSMAEPEVALDRFSKLLLHGRLRPAMKKTIMNAVNKIPTDEVVNRAKLMVNLILSSPDYQVQR